MQKFTLEQFENFLKTIDLNGYRQRFSQIKTVEMDLPRNIQALQTIYEQYWENKDNLCEPLLFDEYYDIYWKSHENEINEFWSKTGFGKDCNCFKIGLKARIYRTWASLITQIQGGYVAQEVFYSAKIEMSVELDHSGVDILIVKNNGDQIPIQVKKVTNRREIRRMAGHGADDEINGILILKYMVPSDFDRPQYLVGAKKGTDKPWVSEFADSGILNRLPNGFVIFRKKFFDGINI